MKRITIVTGTRADYGRLKPVMYAIKKRADMELSIIAAGMHLIPDHGLTVNEILKDGFKVDARVEMHLNGDNGSTMSKSLGIGLIGMTQALEGISPDCIIVLGDRGEALAAAIAGAHMNIPVAHIHGGEVTGTIDESLRHAITKFSHIHFAATEDSKQRIIKLGEKCEYVFNTGSPGLDTILNRKPAERHEILGEFGFNPNEKLIILAQHPVTSEREDAAKQMQETLEAIKALEIQTLIIYPNADAGGRSMINMISKYDTLDHVKAYSNISYEKYLDLLANADVMVGNSSSAIMEAPSFGVPAINVGSRQQGRERGINIIDVDYDRDEIINAINKALSNQEFINKVKLNYNPYGDGNTGEKIVEILYDIQGNDNLIQKRICY
ncbi:UDP-N-acetylglucosamine 2-epimerase [Bacillus mycoides]|uniref:UDP-N-acetylglucosamine 2-epimerase n=1 Tax=Bacillus mycoides TaxID=1405 RepID=UPI001C00E597|nr:UDP-N-acetylglucosamine 2-epimerase [Bacillus mycoides]QWG36139.1 UDP-N-acetylglucosamine 2-epimerase (hydrolyzing) [Bacillus mycoides]